MKWFQVFRAHDETGNASSPSDNVTHISPVSSPVEKPGWLARMGWRSKRTEQLEALQTGYQQLLGLMESIRNHLEEQSRRQETLVNNIPEAIEGLKAVGRAAEQHTEVVQLVKQQFESSVEHDRQLIESMNGFNKTLELMDATSRQSSDMARQMGDRAGASEAMLHAALERSEKRMMGLVAVLTLALLGIGGALVFTVRPDLFGARAIAPTTSPVQAASAPLIAEPPSAPPVLEEPPAPASKQKSAFYFYKKK
ncbi:MAG: hypothetical protein EOM20_09510 [Spartobacteria bacterium]|nr:hypothetical protein [Spartobacteria bacterium]